MDTLDVLKVRRSVRVFKDNQIPKDALEKLVDAGRFAATARNEQPWEFVVITDPGMLKSVAGATDHGRFLGQAAACIAVFCQDTKYYLEDGCAATVNILNAATALGIGSCWIAGDKKPYCTDIAKMLGVPLEYKLVSLIALGYPQANDALRVIEKRALGELLHWEKF